MRGQTFQELDITRVAERRRYELGNAIGKLALADLDNGAKLTGLESEARLLSGRVLPDSATTEVGEEGSQIVVRVRLPYEGAELSLKSAPPTPDGKSRFSVVWPRYPFDESHVHLSKVFDPSTDPDEIREWRRGAVSDVEKLVGQVNQAIDEHNDGLSAYVAERVAYRRSQLTAVRSLADEIGGSGL